MKRFYLLLGMLFITAFLLSAQDAQGGARVINFSQRGQATHEMEGGTRLTANHPTLPLNSKVMIVNTATGKEIEITITGRMPSSPVRIIDLSQNAWRELDMTAGTPVQIYTYTTSPPPSSGGARVTNFSQRGASTYEMVADGFTAAHPSLPIDSKATVTNTATGKEIEVTIIGRIQPSSDRIIDLSQGAASELGLSRRGAVLVTTQAPARTQAPSGFVQYGRATHEIQDERMVAAHPNLPLDSKVKLTNTANGNETEVTIVGRISESSERIIDISWSAASALGWMAEDILLITDSSVVVNN